MEKDVLVPMTPEQYEYWKKGLNNIENELKFELENLQYENNNNQKIINDLRKNLLIFEELKYFYKSLFFA